MNDYIKILFVILVLISYNTSFAQLCSPSKFIANSNEPKIFSNNNDLTGTIEGVDIILELNILNSDCELLKNTIVYLWQSNQNAAIATSDQFGMVKFKVTINKEYPLVYLKIIYEDIEFFTEVNVTEKKEHYKFNLVIKK